MKLSKSQLEILHVLWSLDGPLSMREIADKRKYHIVNRFIVMVTIENLLVKGALYRAGYFHSYSGKREDILVQYAAQLEFDEYYAEKFENIAPQNIFKLMVKIFESDKLNPRQLWSLAALVNAKLKAFED